jgi:hypothetical protein
MYSYPYRALDKPLSFQEAEVSRIFRQSARDGDNVVNPTNRPPLPS